MAQGERPRSFIAALEPDRCASSAHSSRSFASSVVRFFYVSLLAADLPAVSVASTSLPPRVTPTLSTTSPCLLSVATVAVCNKPRSDSLILQKTRNVPHFSHASTGIARFRRTGARSRFLPHAVIL
jgi:hypothetical protein